jgi:peptidoglycan biosynthesis protein MviN/MurJ (putative lipid II flippase)
MLRPGIWGSAVPWQADVTLLIETIMGIALLAGAILARRRVYRAHAWCQSAVVLLNLAVIGLAMMPSFYFQVTPRSHVPCGNPTMPLLQGTRRSE